jgi:hypothetical protein
MSKQGKKADGDPPQRNDAILLADVLNLGQNMLRAATVRISSHPLDSVKHFYQTMVRVVLAGLRVLQIYFRADLAYFC